MNCIYAGSSVLMYYRPFSALQALSMATSTTSTTTTFRKSPVGDSSHWTLK